MISDFPQRSSVYDVRMAAPKAAYPSTLYWIAAFKLFKGLFLLAVAIAVLKLGPRGIAIEIYRWADSFRADPGNRFLRRLLGWLSGFSDQKLRELSVGTFFYSALFLTEGAGLALRRRWAEYFTTIVTASLIPLEIYELVRRTTFPRGVLLVLNLAVVIYLVVDLRRPR